MTAAPRQLEAEAVVAPGCTLGEGPWWDAEAEQPLFVDIEEQVGFSWSEAAGLRRGREYGGRVGFTIPRREGGPVAGVERRLELVDPDDGAAAGRQRRCRRAWRLRSPEGPAG